MILRNKFILFSMIGALAMMPITSEASNTLISLAGAAKQAFDMNKQNNSSSAKLPSSQQSTTDIKTPNLCQQHYPLGAPMVVSIDKDKIERRSFYLCQDDYAVQFDPATKTPIWVAESLNGVEQSGERIERVDNFQPHPTVPYAAQATLNDYKGSKFDRGHNAPAADMRTEQAMEQSFYLTNMFPQVGINMNRGIWADLEAIVRKWSVARGEVLVVTGPIFSPQHATIGRSQVWVPTELYKVIIDPKTLESVAFIMPNQQVITRKTKTVDAGNPNYPQTTPAMAVNCGRTCILDDFIVPLSTVEEKTGLNFFPKLLPQLKAKASQKGRMWQGR
jgi:endonuclease G